ncbi:hypothetical protein PM082_016808 [Marasmius tenuissimus]|nr:hypothetical protein PM082_016808 [Marasmius tenuissimus]
MPQILGSCRRALKNIGSYLLFRPFAVRNLGEVNALLQLLFHFREVDAFSIIEPNIMYFIQSVPLASCPRQPTHKLEYVSRQEFQVDLLQLDGCNLLVFNATLVLQFGEEYVSTRSLDEGIRGGGAK